MDIFENYECDEQIDIFLFLGDETKIKIMKQIRVIELFSGYGSQSLAFEYLGIPIEHHFVCENDKYAMKSYNLLHNTDFKTTDIREVHAPDLNITETDKYCYFMTYSFPCVDLSCSGFMKGMAKGSGTRSGLLWEVERLLIELDGNLPQILMMENVTQIHNQNEIIHFNMWKDFLESIGYISFWKDLNAKDYGIPQNRERTIMFSFLKKEFGNNIVYQFPKPFPLRLSLPDVLEDKVDEKYYVQNESVTKAINELIERENNGTEKKL